jgi:hypothetical protein
MTSKSGAFAKRTQKEKIEALGTSEDILVAQFMQDSGANFIYDQNGRVIQASKDPSEFLEERKEKIGEANYRVAAQYAQKYLEYIGKNFAKDKADEKARAYAKVILQMEMNDIDLMYPTVGNTIAIEKVIANTNLKSVGVTDKASVSHGSNKEIFGKL